MDSKPDPERLAMVAREAETRGFHSIWVPDHVLRVFGPMLRSTTSSRPASASLARNVRRISIPNLYQPSTLNG
jgi:alkanesulfonate monooxygenase SsuD/methylene tetrahydromethanopterin reductase-like flavin-dependent oxidoreductase (luciferase family)